MGRGRSKLNVNIRKKISGHVANKFIGRDAGISWIENTTGMEHEKAEKAFDALRSYAFSGYTPIHCDAQTPWAQEQIKRIDEVLTNKNVPVYDGMIYRGVNIEDRTVLQKAIETGIWREPGITSFSSSEFVAQKFATKGNGANVIIVDMGNKTGVPIQHLSAFGTIEAEVLKPSSIKKKGLKIIAYGQIDEITYIYTKEN